MHCAPAGVWSRPVTRSRRVLDTGDNAATPPHAATFLYTIRTRLHPLLTPAAFGSGLAAALLRAREQACPHKPHELARRVPAMFKGGGNNRRLFGGGELERPRWWLGV